MFWTFIKGIIIGICNVIPGVSGGTAVVILGIYDEFLSILSLNFKRTIKNWRFVLPILLGLAAGVVIFSKAITFFYGNFPVQTNYLFTGLIIGSIPLLAGLAFKSGAVLKNCVDKTKAETCEIDLANGRNGLMNGDGNAESEKVGNDGNALAKKENDFSNSESSAESNFYGEKKSSLVSRIICVIAGIAVIVGFYFAKLYFGGEKTGVELPDFSWNLAALLAVAGFFGAVAMIIPGISGSLVMLIIGVYPVVIGAIPALLKSDTFMKAFVVLCPAGIGIVAGLLAGSWLIKLLLKKCPGQTYSVILGLILGSIINIFPGFTCISSVGMGIGSTVCILGGISAAYFGSKE